MADSRDSFTLSQTRITPEQWKQFDYEIMVHDLIDAIANNDANHLKLYLDNHGDPNLIAEIKNKSSLLHVTITHKKHEMAKLLLQRGASVNAIDNAGSSPLHIAAEIGDIANVTTLLEHGANPNLHNKGGYTPLHLAVKEGLEDIVSILLTHNDIDVKSKNTTNPAVSALTLATITNRADLVSMLIAKGANPNEPVDGVPLFYLVIFMHEDINLVNAFLDGGADPTITTKETEGVSPLILALSKGNLEIAEKIATHKLVDPEKSVLVKKDILREFAKDHHLVATMNMIIASTTTDDKEQELCKLTYAQVVDIINVALMIKNTPSISALTRLSMFNTNNALVIGPAHSEIHFPIRAHTTPR